MSSRESANIWWHLTHKNGKIRRIVTSPYFWEDSFSRHWNRFLGCKILGHRNIQNVDDNWGQKRPFCFKCHQIVPKFGYINDQFISEIPSNHTVWQEAGYGILTVAALNYAWAVVQSQGTADNQEQVEDVFISRKHRDKFLKQYAYEDQCELKASEHGIWKANFIIDNSLDNKVVLVSRTGTAKTSALVII